MSLSGKGADSMGKKTAEVEELTRITVDVPRSMWRALKIRCMDERRSVQGLVRELLADYLKKGASK